MANEGWNTRDQWSVCLNRGFISYCDVSYLVFGENFQFSRIGLWPSISHQSSTFVDTPRRKHRRVSRHAFYWICIRNNGSFSHVFIFLFEFLVFLRRESEMFWATYPRNQSGHTSFKARTWASRSWIRISDVLIILSVRFNVWPNIWRDESKVSCSASWKRMGFDWLKFPLSLYLSIGHFLSL